jgi:hypothetical protein
MLATFGFFNLWQTFLISLSKKQKPNSKKALLFILLPYDTTNVKKIFEWWRRFGRKFEKKVKFLFGIINFFKE